MRITFLRKNLSRALKIITPIIAHQADLTILSNFIIKAGKNSISLSATDLEVGVTTIVRGKISKEGEITIPAQIFSEFITNSTSKKIELTVKDETIYLKGRNSKVQIKGQSSEEFPQIPELDKEKVERIKIPAKKLLTALTRVLIAPTQDDSRPILAGLFFKTTSKTLILAGTDSYRLAEEKINLEEPAQPRQFTVPIKTCQEVARVLEQEGDPNAEVFIDKNQIGYQAGETTMISRLIEGQYPDYKQIIPDHFQTEAVVDRERLFNATKTAWLFSRDQANNVRLQINPSGKLKIKATSPQIGESESVVKLIEAKGPKVESSFNVKFINDVLSVLRTEQVVLGLNESMQPGMIKGQGEDNYLYLIMPLKGE